MLADLLINPVTVQRVTGWGKDDGGGKVPTYADPVALMASVQPMDARRIARYARDGAEVDHMLYFDADPQVGPRDLITWGARVLAAEGPARDAAGRGELFTVAAKMVK